MPGRKRGVKTLHLVTETDQLAVRLSRPSDEDVCPITLNSISEDSLVHRGKQVDSYILSRPELKKMVLPCSHAFGALNLLYHFSRNGVSCPCCRQGPGGLLRSRGLPRHVAFAVCGRSTAAREADREESQRVDAALARQMQVFEVSLLGYVIENGGEVLTSAALAVTTFDHLTRVVTMRSSWVPLATHTPISIALTRPHEDYRGQSITRTEFFAFGNAHSRTHVAASEGSGWFGVNRVLLEGTYYLRFEWFAYLDTLARFGLLGP